MTDPERTIRLLRRMRAGDDGATEELLSLVHGELMAIARRVMGPARGAQTLQPTALVHEAWLRLAHAEGGEFDDRTHFLAVAARAMRSVLIDHARKRKTDKRGGDRERVTLDQVIVPFEESAGDLLALDDAMEELAASEARLARIVELRFFGGLSNDEIAHHLGLSTRSVERGWRTARAWLRRRLGAGGEPPE